MAKGPTRPGKMRDRTKNARVDLEDWLYLDDLAGDQNPIRVAVSECVQAYKQLKKMDDVEIELPWEKENGED